MDSGSHHLHFLLVPLMSAGHLLPMVDIGRLLATQGAIVTIATTPLNANRIKPSIDRATASGLRVRIAHLQLPLLEVGLPNGCESLELIPTRNLMRNFFDALEKLQQPLEHLFNQLEPTPVCILADKYLYWTENIARKFKIPRLLFDGTSCFNLLCFHNILESGVHEKIPQSQPFVVPNLPHRIELTRAQLPVDLNAESMEFKDVQEKIRAAEERACGVVVNSFEELESDYVKEYQKANCGKIWCIGPVSPTNRAARDDAERHNTAIVKFWLMSKLPRSVVYVCLGTLCRLALRQMEELALGLEASKCPFIWVMREDDKGETEKWMIEEGFYERTKDRGLVIYGWSPQVLILSHKAVGAFVTHCGWNSTLEAICAGVPMITWPMFSDQFFNEKLIVQILEIGERVGVEVAVPIGKQEKFGAMVKRDKIAEAIEKVMGEGNDKEERRQRTRKFADLARKAMAVGGSSHLNLKMLIEDVAKLAFGNESS